jgi:nucleoside-diphosphate-sugar epimerase
VVINLAGMSDGKDNWEAFYNANINIVNKLYDWALENKVGHFIQCSTLSVFGFKVNKKVISEEEIPRPSNYYGLSKYFSEILLRMKTSLCLGDMKVTVLRFPSVFGPNNKIGIVAKFVELAKENLPIDLYSNGALTRNLLYIDDVVKLINKTLANKEKLNDYELVHLGSSDSLAMVDIAKVIVTKTNSKSSIIPLDKKASVDWDVYLDLSKMHNILEITTLSVKDGILHYLESLGYEI